MNFRRGSPREEPEINLIAMIDVLLVILIFLMVTTTFTRFAELQINLPTADAAKAVERPNEVHVAIDPQGKYIVNRTPVTFRSPETFGEELRRAAGSTHDPVIVINADAAASHQSVINVMESARLAGMSRITFATQSQQQGK
jgi:biopolymer transport protein ExbD